MSDLEQRVKLLEAKVKILEETLETLKNMGVSESVHGGAVWYDMILKFEA